MDKIRDLLNRKDSIERQIENCRNTDPELTEELDQIEAELLTLGKINEDLPFNICADCRNYDPESGFCVTMFCTEAYDLEGQNGMV